MTLVTENTAFPPRAGSLESPRERDICLKKPNFKKESMKEEWISIRGRGSIIKNPSMEMDMDIF